MIKHFCIKQQILLYLKDFENAGRRPSGEPDECSNLHDRGRIPKRNAPETRKAKGIFLLPFLLSGCMGIYEGGFECPPGEGTKCKSISEVNELINKQQVPGMRTQEVKERGCPVGSDLEDLPCNSPDAIAPEILTPTLWWNPLLDQDIPSSTRDKAYVRSAI